MAVNTLKNDAQNLSIQNIDSEHTSAAITKNLTLKKADQIYYASMSSLLENIEDNALICIGGSRPWTADLFLQADYQHPTIQNFYNKIEDCLKQNKENPEFLKWIDALYEEIGYGIDKELFMHMVQYTGTYNNTFGLPEDIDLTQQMERSKAYSPTTSPKLSQLFDKKLIMCAEIATLAQKYFKNKGYKVYLVNGGIVAELDKENGGDSQAHSFLLFEQEDGERIFDPSMPIKYNGKGYPHIIKIPDQLSFLEHFKKDQLFAIKDPKFNLYYGNGAGAQTTLYEENILKTPSSE